jgi:hypothetical protein
MALAMALAMALVLAVACGGPSGPAPLDSQAGMWSDSPRGGQLPAHSGATGTAMSQLKAPVAAS